MVFDNMTSCLIFLEAIDKLEEEIANSIKIERPAPLLQRAGTELKLMIRYYNRFGINYIKE
jgi:hypothetical protein